MQLLVQLHNQYAQPLPIVPEAYLPVADGLFCLTRRRFYPQSGRRAIHQRLAQSAKRNGMAAGSALQAVDAREQRYGRIKREHGARRKRGFTLIEHSVKGFDGVGIPTTPSLLPFTECSIRVDQRFPRLPCSRCIRPYQAFLSRHDSKFGLFLSSDETGKFTSEPYSPPLW